jgi:hypothetical protein
MEKTMQKLKIYVTSEEIDHAVKNDSHHCMIADALQRTIPSAKYIMVDLQSIRFTDVEGGQRYIYLTPPSAQKAIIDFDHGNPNLKPFSFSMTKGYSRQMRVRSPGFQRTQKAPRSKTKTTKKSSHPKREMPGRYREFGLREIK